MFCYAVIGQSILPLVLIFRRISYQSLYLNNECSDNFNLQSEESSSSLIVQSYNQDLSVRLIVDNSFS